MHPSNNPYKILRLTAFTLRERFLRWILGSICPFRYLSPVQRIYEIYFVIAVYLKFLRDSVLILPLSDIFLTSPYRYQKLFSKIINWKLLVVQPRCKCLHWELNDEMGFFYRIQWSNRSTEKTNCQLNVMFCSIKANRFKTANNWPSYRRAWFKTSD